MTSPADGVPLTGNVETMPTFGVDTLGFTIAWNDVIGMDDYWVYIGTGSAGVAANDIRDSGALGDVNSYDYVPSDSSDTVFVPVDGTTFYITLFWSNDGFSTFGEVRYAVTITAGEEAVAVNLNEARQIAQKNLTGPIGRGTLDPETGQADLAIPIPVRMRKITLQCDPPKDRFEFDHKPQSFWGRIIDAADPDVTTDFTDHRYYVRPVQVNVVAPANGENDPVVFSQLASPEGDPITATNVLEEIAGTHDLAAGTIVHVFPGRGGDLPHTPRYLISAGGVAGSGCTGQIEVPVGIPVWDDTSGVCNFVGSTVFLTWTNGRLTGESSTDPGGPALNCGGQ